jgi:Zn-dependent peptidase ImmA (M78 family)
VTTVKEEARFKAKETLSVFWGDEGYPIDPIAIARRLGVEVFVADLPDTVSGMLRKEQNEAASIYIDTDDPRVRQRFTCAHEIGHYLRHTSSDDGAIAFVDYRGATASRGDDSEEIFANEFAAELLMPESRLRQLFGAGFRELEFSEYFGVSVESAKWRLVNLGLTRAA